MNRRLETLLIALVLIGLAAFAYFAYFLGGSHTGLYKHVRKAEEYIDEGKYEKALFMLHKAYEEAPESEKIETALLSGYLRYSRHLKDRGDLDMAIDYMDMAYEMAPENKTVINELAFYYCKKAVEESKNKDYVRSIRTLQKATDLAIKSKRITGLRSMPGITATGVLAADRQTGTPSPRADQGPPPCRRVRR